MNIDDLPEDLDPSDPIMQRLSGEALADVLEITAVCIAHPGDAKTIHEAYERVVESDEHAMLLLGASIGLLTNLVRDLECPHQSVGDVLLKLQARVDALREQA